ncbi:hypothetical protein AB7M35_001819 [Amorphus suaedae]
MPRFTIMALLSSAVLAALAHPHQARAQDADLAKQLSNPIASLISVPFIYNYDRGFGPEDGYRTGVTIQPVIPIALSDDWNVISRTITPIVWQDDIAGNSGRQFGLSDTVQSLFLSPRATGPGGLTWGVGPVFLLPTATDPLLGSERWGAGPTGVALKQTGPWTYGLLANHIWSFAGHDDRNPINATFLQPFLSYTTADAWTFSLNTETTYDWETEDWSVPINAAVSKLVTIQGQPISLQAGLRYWAASGPAAAEGFGGKVGITFLFPKKN